MKLPKILYSRAYWLGLVVYTILMTLFDYLRDGGFNVWMLILNILVFSVVMGWSNTKYYKSKIKETKARIDKLNKEKE